MNNGEIYTPYEFLHAVDKLWKDNGGVPNIDESNSKYSTIDGLIAQVDKLLDYGFPITSDCLYYADPFHPTNVPGI